MCPACIAAAAVLVGQASSVGGAMAIAARTMFLRRSKGRISEIIQAKENNHGDEHDGKEESKSSFIFRVAGGAQGVSAKEKEFTRLRDELSRERRELPWEKVEKSYTFEGPNGKETLADLFDGRSQLVVYHFMLGPGWSEGCKSCSYLADHFDGMTVHLANRDVTFVVVSRAPLAEIEAFKQRMGWRFKWVSSSGSDFNFDYHVSFSKDELASGKVDYNYNQQSFGSEEAPGVSAFYKD